jgi:hypothetical protein
LSKISYFGLPYDTFLTKYRIVENETNKQFQKNDVFSKRIRAGKRRTYFFDVRTTKGNDYYLTITESKKRFHDDGYERHKIFVYKEDFNKFIHTLEEVVDHIKQQLMPDYDFDTYTRDPEDVTAGADGSPAATGQEAGSETGAERTNHVPAAEAESIAQQSDAGEHNTNHVPESDVADNVQQIQEGSEEEVISWD